jgi:G-patch domain
MSAVAEPGMGGAGKTRKENMGSTGETFGRAMLERMGWSQGTGLGAQRDGVVAPVLPKTRHENLGIGAERRREFHEAWWETAFETAYNGAKVSKKAKGGDELEQDAAQLLAACEGRRCRPHGSAKLARMEKADAEFMACGGTMAAVALANVNEAPTEERRRVRMEKAARREAKKARKQDKEEKRREREAKRLRKFERANKKDKLRSVQVGRVEKKTIKRLDISSPGSK